MANQPEEAVFDETVYQFATTDVIEGGPDGIDNVPLLQLANRTRYLKTVLDQFMAIFMSGKGMVLWQKAANLIPEGWQEVVDWRGRLPIGYSPSDATFSIGNTGGAKQKTLITNNLPNINFPRSESNEGEVDGTRFLMSSDQAAGSYTMNGGSQAIDILNPYRVVVFIEYVGLNPNTP